MAMVAWAIAFVGMVGVEALILSLAFDGATIGSSAGAAGLVKWWGPWAARWALATIIFSAGILYRKREELPGAGGLRRAQLWWLAGNGVCYWLLWAASRRLYAGEGAGTGDGIAWILAALGTIIAGALAALPAAAWLRVARAAGWPLGQAAFAGAAACLVGEASKELWDAVRQTTFRLAEAGLGLFHREFISQPERMRLGTERFRVIISEECSGLEGMGLMLIFGLGYLFVFRREYRFPQALLLAPIGMGILYLLNVARIVGLIELGDAGYADIAARGFHSQAGWIAFCTVAIGCLAASTRIGWLAQEPKGVGEGAEYTAAPYLLPFLALMSAGIVSQAMTGGFEWTYGIRIPAVAAAIWYCRNRYEGVDWKFGGMAAMGGACAFAIWIAVDELLSGTRVSGVGGAAAGEFLTGEATARGVWLALRVAGAVAAVPVAEELAFRGFLQRRLVSGDFEAVPWRERSWRGLAGASILFGMLHGRLWPAGIAAGLIYGWLMGKRGRLGDAVGAHAITNGLLAGYVLLTGRWDLW